MTEPPTSARSRQARALVLLVALLVVVSLAAVCLGAVRLHPGHALRLLFGLDDGTGGDAARDALIIHHIRLPRLLLGISVGAALAVAGAIMQGLFRNPLADPGLIGVSSGAAFAAALTIVFGERLMAASALPFAALPVASFVGALSAMLLLYAVSSRRGRTSIGVMLLAGVAFTALAGAGTGWLAFVSDDRQLRDITFWSLGSLGAATWLKVEIVAPMILTALLAMPFIARGLNAMSLGESEAFHLGINVQRLKGASIVLAAILVGAAVSCSGLIGFVGIVVPHLLRLCVGPSYRFLLPASALLGASLLVLADVLARTLAAPSEVPIGIVTATVGAPFFLWLLLRKRQEFDL